MDAMNFSAADPDRALSDAWKALETEKQKIKELGKHWEEASTTVRAKDQSFDLTFDGRGELVDLAFNGERYRKLAPAQLAELIVETVGKGRAEAQQKVSDVVGQSEVQGLDLEGLMTGKVSPDKLIDSLLGPMLEGMGLGAPTEPAERTRKERTDG